MELVVERWEKRKGDIRLTGKYHDDRVRDAMIEHIFSSVEFTRDAPCNREVLDAMAKAHGCTLVYEEVTT